MLNDDLSGAKGIFSLLNDDLSAALGQIMTSGLVVRATDVPFDLGRFDSRCALLGIFSAE